MTPRVRISPIGGGATLTLPWPSSIAITTQTMIALRWDELEWREYLTLTQWAASRVQQEVTRSNIRVLLAYGGQPVCVELDWLEPYSGTINIRSYAGMLIIASEVQERSRLGLEVALMIGDVLYRPGQDIGVPIACGSSAPM